MIFVNNTLTKTKKPAAISRNRLIFNVAQNGQISNCFLEDLRRMAF